MHARPRFDLGSVAVGHAVDGWAEGGSATGGMLRHRRACSSRGYNRSCVPSLYHAATARNAESLLSRFVAAMSFISMAFELKENRG